MEGWYGVFLKPPIDNSGRENQYVSFRTFLGGGCGETNQIGFVLPSLQHPPTDIFQGSRLRNANGSDHLPFHPLLSTRDAVPRINQAKS